MGRSLLIRMVVVAAMVSVVAGAGSAYDVESVAPQPIQTSRIESAVALPPSGPASTVIPLRLDTVDAALERMDLRTARFVLRALRGPSPSAIALLEGPEAGPETLAEALALNRELHPFPPVPPDSGEGRRIVYDNSDQRIWIISESGTVIDSYLVSGKRGEPRIGTYRVYSKSPHATAFYGGITMNWMVRFAYGSKNGISIGFHDLPLYPDGTPMMTEDQFGTPLSGGCVRQPDEKAQWLYGWADIGTVVVVLP